MFLMTGMSYNKEFAIRAPKSRIEIEMEWQLSYRCVVRILETQFELFQNNSQMNRTWLIINSGLKVILKMFV